MLKKLKILILLLVITSVNVHAYTDSDTIIASLNTQLNTQILSYFIENPQNVVFLSSSQQQLIKENSEYEIIIDSSTYYFIKNNGLYTSCTNCNDLVTITLSIKDINFIYDNKNFLYNISQDGYISYYEAIQLKFKHYLY